MEVVNRDAGSIPAEQNCESEHYTHCDGPRRNCGNCPPVHQQRLPRRRDLGELIARAVAAAMTPQDAQLKMLQTEIIAMKSLEGINGSDGMGDI